MRTIPDISQLLTPLEDAIHQEFIPSLSGRPTSSNVERKIFALPARPEGLGLIDPMSCSDCSFQSSTKVTAQLVDLTISQQLSGGPDPEIMLSTKKEIRLHARLSAIQQASNLEGVMDQCQKRLVTLGKEKGSSLWLTSLPIEEHGFHFHKGEFRDALCLRYG